ncbi:MAG: LytR/AlgR family response regulator transcription factor, partial [Sarcina sp.]
IPIKIINYIEVYGRTITIFTEEKKYSVNMRLHILEEKLQENNFFRCHKSYLVNMEKIQSITKKSLVIEGVEIPLSKYRIKDLKKSLTRVFGKMIK